MSIRIRTAIYLALIVIAGLILRIQGLFHTLEYDEIWTLQTFSGQGLQRIFSDFDLPNNHPLNTIAVLLAYFGKECAWTIRLGAFFASVATIIAGFFLGRRLSGRRTGLFTALALAVLPAFTAQGYTARGYSGQLLFLLLTALFLLKSQRSKLFAVAAFISGVLAALSLPTSILWLFVFGCIILARSIKKKNFRNLPLYTISAIGIFNTAWLLSNLASYRKGTAFQVALEGFYPRLEYLFSIFSANGFPLYISIFCAIVQFRRKLIWSLFFCALFAPLATLCTTPGPFRVYLPSAAAGVLLIASMLPHFCARFKSKPVSYTSILFILLLIPAYFISSAKLEREPDWKHLGDFVSKLPPSVLPCFNAANGFPAQWNYPDFTRQFINRLQYCSQLPRCMLLICGNTLSGIAADGTTLTLPMPHNSKKTDNREAELYTVELEQRDRLHPGESGFVILPVQPTEQLNQQAKYLLQKCKFLVMLNSFMTIPLQLPGQKTPYRYRLFFITAATELQNSPGIKIFTPIP